MSTLKYLLSASYVYFFLIYNFIHFCFLPVIFQGHCFWKCSYSFTCFYMFIYLSWLEWSMLHSYFCIEAIMKWWMEIHSCVHCSRHLKILPCICMCVHICVNTNHSLHMEFRVQLCGVGTFSVFMWDFRKWAQSIRLCGKILYSQSHMLALQLCLF